MIFLSLVAHAFGPFRGRTLAFAPGMNVVHGRNEAGKSSLHAALYAGLCGARRGRGKKGIDEEFERRHRPWDGEGWKVSVIVRLEDGRKVELAQDLENKDKSTAKDADLGRECRDLEFIDGALDGSKWLGLDRRSFLATACVRQAELLAVLDDPKALQEQLQRAVDTSGTDSTAAAALARLDSFQKEHVGQERKNSTKPLQLACEALRRAETGLEQARAERDAYLRLLASEEECKVAAEEIGRRLRLQRAVRAAVELRSWDERRERARWLAARHPDGPPAGLASADDLARRAAEALQAWKSRPELVPLAGASAADLGRELATLPETPPGDVLPAPQVTEAANEYAAARMSADRHAGRRPPEPESLSAGGASPGDLRSLATVLAAPEPLADAALEAQRSALARRIRDLSRRDRLQTALVAAGVAALAAGLALVVSRHPVPGAGLAALGASLGILGLLRRVRRVLVDSHAELRQIEWQLEQARSRREEWLQDQEEARLRAAKLGLAPDAGALGQLAGALESAGLAQRDFESWGREAEELGRLVESRAGILRQILGVRGVAPTRDLEADARGYAESCSARAARQALEEKIAARRREEDAAARALRLRQEASAALRRAAAECGLAGDGEEDMVAGLSAWLSARGTALADHEQELREWTELQSLLAGKTRREFESEVDARREAARLAAVGFDAQEIEPQLRSPAAIDAEIAALDDEASQRQRGLAEARTLVRECEARLASVAEAEEALAAAQAELERLRALDATLERTRSFLVKAQEQVHRSIAPVLSAELRDWLPAVTAGRYCEARVDPETLEVQVRAAGAPWRAAAVLSHGTAEQVYLGLRIAMARHLTARGEICPLLLDDATVQCDTERKIAVLEALRTASAERQVIFFTQEDEVLEWAEKRLVSPRDGIQRLDAASIAP